MIYLLVGENSFLRRQKIDQIVDGRDVIRRDGTSLAVADIATLLAGNSLFGGDDVVVIEDAASNKAVWEAIDPWLNKIDAKTTIVLAETRPDKRTKTYKTVTKLAEIIVCDNWTPNQAAQAQTWLVKYAKSNHVALDGAMASQMVERATRPGDTDAKPVIDQALLARVIDQLRLLEGPVTQVAIETVLPPATHENVFILLESAIDGRTDKVQEMIRRLRISQDGHQTLGLLAGQVTTIAALVIADVSSEKVASDIGAHPFALRQLSGTARRLSRAELVRIVGVLTRVDQQFKHTRAEPWVLLEAALMRIALKK